jgi:hypothetical protein
MQQFWLEGRGIGKARPRFSSGIVHTCPRYGRWKFDAIATIKKLRLPGAPKPCFVECFFVNFLSSDADNLQGSVLDAMVQAGYLENDSSSFVVGCSGVFVKQRKVRNQEKTVGILVRVKPALLELFEW